VNEDKAARYHRLKRRAAVLALAASIVILLAILASGASVALRSAAEGAASSIGSAVWRDALVVLLYVAGLMMIHEAAGLPFAFYSGFMLERRYGLSNERLSAWLKDQAKSLGVGLILGGAAARIIYGFIRRDPLNWWLPAGAIFAVLIVGLTNLAPVVLLPLFFRVKPLNRDVLRARLLGLAERAGARVVGAYEWGLAEKTRKANAALAGLGRTRRILVSDTMLAEYSDDEIEVVLAHELAHHVHGDIWKGIVFEIALVVAGFFLAARILAAFAGVFGLSGPADPAGLPLLLLAAGAVSLLMVPAAHALSRAYERSADRFALELTKNPGAFISAMRRLGAQNLAEEQPSRIIQWLFYSHPPLRERIEAAQAFRPKAASAGCRAPTS
jgi:Zn-dependent protease with chaperone function